MKVDLTDLSPVKKQMAVEVAPEEVGQVKDGIIQGYRDKAKIPGFRPGKAPKAMVLSRYAKEIEEDTRERLLTKFFFEAVREKGLSPIGDPAVEDLEHPEGGTLSFRTTFEVLPEIELQDYSGVELHRTRPTVTDEEVNGALEELRRSRAQLIEEDGRVAGKGDVVFVDLEGEPEGGEPFKREQTAVEIGNEANLPEFNDELSGAKAGDERDFTVTYPEGYGAKEIAGKPVRYRIKVQEVKRKELPDLDDEFAKALGEFDDLGALETKIREDLLARKEHEEKHSARQSLLEKILLANVIVLPEVLVDHEVRHRLEEIARNMIMQGVDPEKAEIDWADVRKRQEEPARKAVHARLVLDAVGDKEGIDVPRSEVNERIRQEAARSGQNYEELRDKVREGGGLETLSRQLVREKSLDYLMSVANIQYSD